MTRQLVSLTLEDARKAIAAGERKALALGIPYNIAVVDSGGGLIAHARMDGAWLASIDIAIDKAWTARAVDMPTEALAQLAQSGQQGFGINTTNQGRIVFLAAESPLESVAPSSVPWVRAVGRLSRTSRSPGPQSRD